MKRILLLIFLVSIATGSFAQDVTIRNDTIFTGKTAYAILRKSTSKPVRCRIYAIDGKELMEAHYSHLNTGSKPLYVVTFLNDYKQAMVTGHADFPKSFATDIVKNHLIHNNTVDLASEQQFINIHALPLGYTDVNEIIDY